MTHTAKTQAAVSANKPADRQGEGQHNVLVSGGRTRSRQNFAKEVMDPTYVHNFEGTMCYMQYITHPEEGEKFYVSWNGYKYRWAIVHHYTNDNGPGVIIHTPCFDHAAHKNWVAV